MANSELGSGNADPTRSVTLLRSALIFIPQNPLLSFLGGFFRQPEDGLGGKR
ncbi:hypothetical protein IQ273_09445 [Nodosilinea sp. LEGE 07298]|uniref:hypothetical protein n=1 Tax=Nodosilinea sp. LEGE 07298 TaxID=2777970 RepID=UPI001880A855|nr:hypothetical protein [Nodosilinea sp. LEGE 07298]MBE9109641.1 hypothetical protein [Nodosilinea sp. LEGE 07298]